MRTTVLEPNCVVQKPNSALSSCFSPANHHFAGQKRGSEDGFRCFGLFSVCEPLFSNDFSWFAFQIRQFLPVSLPVSYRFRVNYRGSHSWFVRCGSHCSRKSCNMHRGWQIRRPATQSSRRKLDARARSSCFVLPYIDPFFLRTTVLLSNPVVPVPYSVIFACFPAVSHTIYKTFRRYRFHACASRIFLFVFKKNLTNFVRL